MKDESMDRSMRDVLDDDGPVIPPRGVVTLVLVGIAGVAIVYNALIAQSGRHPAPFAASWESAQDDGFPLKPREGRTDTGDAAPAGDVAASVPKPPAQPDAGGEPAQGDPLIGDIQRDLAALDIYDGPMDGLEGPKTREAIEAYQRDQGIAATGEATAELREHIRFNLQVLKAARFTDSTGDGEERRRVRLVQTGLAELGYSPGPVDGMMGEQTHQAIRDFQRDRAIPVTGEIGPELVEELGKVSGLSSLSNL